MSIGVPFLDPQPVVEDVSPIPSGSIVYWDPISGEAYLLEPADMGTPGVDEYLRSLGLVPYQGPPAPGSPSLGEIFNPPDGTYESNLYQSRVSDINAKILERNAAGYQRDIGFLNADLDRTQKQYEITSAAAQIDRARKEQASRFANALRFNGQEEWRARQREADAVKEDALLSLQQASATDAIRKQIANAQDNAVSEQEKLALLRSQQVLNSFDLQAALGQNKNG